MTTVASIIQSALRETNLIPLGVAPTTEQSDEAFGLLSSIVASVLGNDAGENLNPIPLGRNDINSPNGYPWWSNELPGNIFMPTNARIMCNLTAPGHFYLHPRPHDGARMGIIDVSGNFDTNPLTIYGNGRMLEGAEQQTYSTANTIRQWVYREDLANWVVVIPLEADGDMPWPPEFDDMFIILLALRLSSRYGQAMQATSMETLRDVASKFKARYTQSTTNQQPAEDGLTYLTNTYRYYGRNYGHVYGDPNAFFNSGWAW